MDEQINKPVDTATAAPENTTPLAQQPVTATQQPTTATQAPQSSIPLTSSVTARPAENLPAGVSDYSAEIAQLYDAQMAAQAQALETAYNQNLEAANYSKSQIDPAFNKQGNDLATQYERTRRNNNLRADMNGLNTGAASQMDLAQQSNYLDAFGKVRAEQAKAATEADRQIANLEIAYKSQVAQALANNDYQKATALMREYQRRDAAAEEMRRYNQAQAEQDAKVRAAYGDFGGYESLYGAETANAMKQFWAMNNPDYAYSMGMITAAQYEQMTGYSPDRSSLYSGYSSGGGSSRSSGGYSRSYSSSPNNKPDNNPNGPGAIDGSNGNVGNAITAPLEKLSTEQQLKIAAGVMSGDISADSNLRDAYYAYHMIESDAKNLVRQSGVDPNSEQGKQLVDAAVSLYYKDPNVSLEDIQSLQNNRTANAQANAQQLKTESRKNREDEERLDNEKYIQSQINYGSKNGKKEVKTTSKNANGSTGKKVVQAK